MQYGVTSHPARPQNIDHGHHAAHRVCVVVRTHSVQADVLPITLLSLTHTFHHAPTSSFLLPPPSLCPQSHPLSRHRHQETGRERRRHRPMAPGRVHHLRTDRNAGRRFESGAGGTGHPRPHGIRLVGDIRGSGGQRVRILAFVHDILGRRVQRRRRVSDAFIRQLTSVSSCVGVHKLFHF